jgi:putative NADH-flavin reductase
MRILIFGATGRTGRELVSQALRRGHDVSAFVRNPGKLTVVDARLRVVQGGHTACGIDERTTHRILSRGERNSRRRLLPKISRADVAHFMLEELENPRHVRQVVPLCY